jgi:putative colanic acid biosynthesis acetyltransferase WcaF
MFQADLSSFDNSWYSPGRSTAVRALWFFVGAPIVRWQLLPSSSIRRFILRCFGAKVERGVVLKPGVRVKYPWRLVIGAHSWIGEDVWIDNLVEVKIGKNACLSQGAYLCTGNHDWSDKSFGLRALPIVVEDGSWVGARTLVCPGVTIGESGVAAAGSVITKSVPAFEIHSGNPARFVKRRIFRRPERCPADAVPEYSADLGSRLKARLTDYVGAQHPPTTVPLWGIVEPAVSASVDETERRSLFGNSKLALMCSGNLGRAHSYQEVFDVAGGFSPSEAKFVFGARGKRLGELTRAVETGPPNVKMAQFATFEAMQKQLAAADIHIVTLRSGWTGTAVPSEFFGAIATGRPVLFIGSASSEIASWVKEFGVGWVLDTRPSSDAAYQLEIARIVRELKELAEDRAPLEKLFRHCHSVYRTNLSRKRILDQWHQERRASATGGTEAFGLDLSPVLTDSSSGLGTSRFMNSLHTKPVGERGRE